MENSILVIAPGHDEIDHRVKRSFAEILKVFSQSVLYFESTRVTKSFSEKPNVKSYKPIPLLDLALFRKRVLNDDIFIQAMSHKYIYIHDSGLYGVFLAQYLNRYFPQKKLIFDYHDYIDWEVSHHIGKYASSKKIRKVFLECFLFLLNKLILSKLKIHALIGISSKQLESFNGRLTQYHCSKQLVVPNTRERQESSFNALGVEDCCNFLWVGNVGKNRSVERLDAYVRRFLEYSRGRRTNLLFIGKIWGDCSELLHNSNYLGGYDSDGDVLNLLPREKNIGTFLGWDDDFSLGINEISSPNKFYTYVNIGIPFLIPTNLASLIDSCHVEDCFCFVDENDFITKAEAILSNYSHYCFKVSILKESIVWDSDIRKELLNFYTNLEAESAL